MLILHAILLNANRVVLAQIAEELSRLSKAAWLKTEAVVDDTTIIVIITNGGLTGGARDA